MFLSVYLMVLAQGFPPSSSDVGTSPRARFDVKLESGALTFDWHDADDRVRGVLDAESLKSGVPTDVSVHVGPLEGAEYRGPVTMTFRPAGQIGGGFEQTVSRATDGKGWKFRITPEDAVPYALEFGFRTTRAKVIRGELAVREGPLPRWLGWAVGLTLVLGAVGGGVVALVRAQRREEASGGGSSAT